MPYKTKNIPLKNEKWYNFQDFYTAIFASLTNSEKFQCQSFQISGRFPPNKLYFCENFGIWTEIFQENNQDLKILQTLNALNQRQDLFDRFSYETKFNLEWEEENEDR